MSEATRFRLQLQVADGTVLAAVARVSQQQVDSGQRTGRSTSAGTTPASAFARIGPELDNPSLTVPGSTGLRHRARLVRHFFNLSPNSTCCALALSAFFVQLTSASPSRGR